MASLEKINEALIKLAKLIEPLKPLMKCHMVDFLTANHWETLLPLRIQEDLLSLPKEKLYLMPSGAMPIDDCQDENNEALHLPSSNLSSLLSVIRSHSLHSLGVTTDIQQILDAHGSSEIPIQTIDGIMSDKKSHEVDVMSQVIARLAKGFGANWIMDLGSGKGYLSSSLVLQYGLNVLAMDSSPINTTSALTRNTKLEKLLRNLRKAEQNYLEGKPTKRGRRKKSKNQIINDPSQPGNTIEQNKNVPGSYIGLTAFITEDSDLLQILKENLASEANSLNSHEQQEDISGKLDDEVTGNITQDNNKSAPSDSRMNEKCNDIAEQCSKQRTPIDAYKEKEISLVRHNASSLDEAVLGLVGLHTCGNLASSSIRLFISNNKVKFICNVGCCYHLIEEEFCKNPFHTKRSENSTKEIHEEQAQNSLPKTKNELQNSASFDPMHPSTIPNLSIGFPLSSILRERKFSLERNTRMLSCQATDRLTGHPHSGLDSLYWRALLQVLLKKELGDALESYNVGRIASKCKDFVEYARKALNKLQLNIEVTDEEIYDLEKNHQDSIKKIERFFILRSTLAPLIEGLILLDRLALLCEQEDIEAAYLVQLFNPVTSPRCHAVIGIRGK